jgi:putative ABC transport system permease protein
VEEVIETKNRKLPLAITRITSLNQDFLRKNPHRLIAVAYNIEEVPELTRQIKTWLDQNFDEGSEAFQVITNKSRVEQTRKGMLLFKLIMGLITGISVVVGGTGVMNVLLISITERTAEIGIRKATGAKRRDILLQLLSESVTMAGLGSIASVILGMLVSLLAVPVIEHLIDVSFEAVFTFSTFVVIATLAFAVGIIFGTYPALRASRLTPIAAIGREWNFVNDGNN